MIEHELVKSAQKLLSGVMDELTVRVSYDDMRFYEVEYFGPIREWMRQAKRLQESAAPSVTFTKEKRPMTQIRARIAELEAEITRPARTPEAWQWRYEGKTEWNCLNIDIEKFHKQMKDEGDAAYEVRPLFLTP